MTWISNVREHSFSIGAMLVLAVYAGSLLYGIQASSFTSLNVTDSSSLSSRSHVLRHENYLVHHDDI